MTNVHLNFVFVGSERRKKEHLAHAKVILLQDPPSNFTRSIYILQAGAFISFPPARLGDLFLIRVPETQTSRGEKLGRNEVQIE